jgi:hypothetical protein
MSLHARWFQAIFLMQSKNGELSKASGKGGRGGRMVLVVVVRRARGNVFILLFSLIAKLQMRNNN